jgi:hypothetical protein
MAYRLVDGLYEPNMDASIFDGPITKRDLYLWDGKRLNVPRDLSASNILHEVAHWLIAPPSRRSCPEYGLGTAAESVRRSKPRVKAPHRAIEEGAASLLGIIYLAAIGARWRPTAKDHGWTVAEGEARTLFDFVDESTHQVLLNYDDDLLDHAIDRTVFARILRTKRLLDEHNMPTIGAAKRWPYSAKEIR